jgi:hypothetical protein
MATVPLCVCNNTSEALKQAALRVISATLIYFELLKVLRTCSRELGSVQQHCVPVDALLEVLSEITKTKANEQQNITDKDFATPFSVPNKARSPRYQRTD